MERFKQRSTPFLYALIALSSLAVFLADMFLPLGVAVFVFYLSPVALCLFVWRPSTPIVLGFLLTGFLTLGYFLSPPGINPETAQINRTVCVLTVWVMAGVAHQFIRNKLFLHKEQWLQSGQTTLSERMRGEQTLEQLGENVLRCLSEYLQAHAAALFVEERRAFRRVGTYAVPAQSGVPDRFAPGEGLLGQAAKDARPFIVNDVPDGYLLIGSALGQSRPRHLLIAPLTADGVVNGVMEFGFFYTLDTSNVELLERVGESIGIAVRSAKDRTRLQELLAETQRQAEELQAQSEELRVSNEELSEQSRALKESQARLELQQAELEQTNSQLAEQTQILEAQKDQLSRAKNALERQTRELEQASKYKSDFLANMSHELRTPLNSSLILAKLLADNREGNLNAEQVRYAQTIESSGNDLLALITDILDLSKIEAGRMELKREPVSIGRVLENLGRLFQPLATEKKLGFRSQIVIGTPETIESDAQRLEQVLKNILSNAFKFTERGEIVLTASRADEGGVAFSVTDTGIGIAPDQHQMIFEPFRQADGTTNRKYGGTGLGLSISRELVHLLGGQIILSSQAGQGSTFTVILPDAGKLSQSNATQPSTPASAAESKLELDAFPDQEPPSSSVREPKLLNFEDDAGQLEPGKRMVLAVEDDPAFARILYDLAHELGFQCVVAGRAEEALSLARQHAPSGVILDVGLPDNSGLSVLDRLKADPRTRHIPVHVVSASDYSQTALAMGAVGYMLKPVKHEQLVQAFRQLETKLIQRVRKVLVVEDDPVQLDSVKQLLSSRDVEAIGVRTAAECLQTLKTSTVDCMVLDLNLPDASGFSLLDELSRGDSYGFPPVIVYTGRDLTGEEEQRLRAYSRSVIIKGAKSPERLLDEVTLFLHQVVADLPPEQQKMLGKARHRDAALEGKRILVAEDDVRNVFALTSILEPRGAQVKIARNGREALAMLERASKNPAEAVDLVLMDIMMPEMDGLTAMREIRKRAEWKKLPIIALTAKAMKTDQEHCLEAGANDYMAKPLDVDKLLSLVRVWLPR